VVIRAIKTYRKVGAFYIAWEAFLDTYRTFRRNRRRITSELPTIRELPRNGDDEHATCMNCGVVSMGRRNTGQKSNLQLFQWLNSFESADSKKTLPCLGSIEYIPKDQVSLKNTIGSTE
jgi:hypothetical protein